MSAIFTLPTARVNTWMATGLVAIARNSSRQYLQAVVVVADEVRSHRLRLEVFDTKSGLTDTYHLSRQRQYTQRKSNSSRNQGL